MNLTSKRRAKSKTARRSRARASVASLCPKALPVERLKLLDPIRILLAAATVFRNIANLASGPQVAVLSAAADDLERHAQCLTHSRGRGAEG